MVTDGRKFKRNTMEIDAFCWLGQCTVVRGTIKDMSAGGVFFQPECGYTGEKTYGFSRDIFSPGDKIKIEIGDGIVMHAEVRWKGDSDRHHVFGTGLEYEFDYVSDDCHNVTQTHF